MRYIDCMGYHCASLNLGGHETLLTLFQDTWPKMHGFGCAI